MKTYRCGCATEPVHLIDYCAAHRFARCHIERYGAPAANRNDAECPACWHDRMATVNTSYATTRLGRQRIADRRAGIDPRMEVRIAERDEFPGYLTNGSKVRTT